MPQVHACPSCSNQDRWSALVRTKDVTPPVLTIVDKPPPGFTSFSLVVALDEPGTIYGAVLLTSQAEQVEATPTCAPDWKVGMGTSWFSGNNSSCLLCSAVEVQVPHTHTIKRMTEKDHRCICALVHQPCSRKLQLLVRSVAPFVNTYNALSTLHWVV